MLVTEMSWLSAEVLFSCVIGFSCIYRLYIYDQMSLPQSVRQCCGIIYIWETLEKLKVWFQQQYNESYVNNYWIHGNSKSKKWLELQCRWSLSQLSQGKRRGILMRGHRPHNHKCVFGTTRPSWLGPSCFRQQLQPLHCHHQYTRVMLSFVITK